MTNKRVIYIPVEVKKREWIAKLLLSLYCVEHGYNVVIGDHGPVRDYALTQNNGVYIEKDMYKLRSESLMMLKKRGFDIMALDEEGLFKGNRKKFGGARLAKETIEICDAIIAWGQEEKNEIIECAEEAENKIYPIGNPRLDLLRRNGLKLYGSTILKKPIILVISAFNLLSYPEYYSKVMDNVIKHNGGKQADIDELKAQYYWQKDAFPMFAKGIMYLVENNIANVVIRPHPGENPYLWKKIFKGHKNVFITSSHDANFWIKEAALMIHAGSTTSIESVLMGKYSILYLPKDYELYEGAPLENASSIHLRNENELLSVCKRIINGESSKHIYEEYTKNNIKDIINSYIGLDKKITCCENIVRIIDDLSQNKKEFSNCCLISKSRWKVFYNDIKRMILTPNVNEKFLNTSVYEVKKDLYNIAKAWSKNCPSVYTLQNQNLFYICKDEIK